MKKKIIIAIPIIIVLLIGYVIGSKSCESMKNLEKAEKVYERVEIGMGREDACWNFEVSCENVRPDYTYERDIGMSFSGTEYSVRIFIKNDKLVRVELIKPYHKYWMWGTRISTREKETIVEEKGISYEEFIQPAEAE